MGSSDCAGNRSLSCQIPVDRMRCRLRHSWSLCKWCHLPGQVWLMCSCCLPSVGKSIKLGAKCLVFFYGFSAKTGGHFGLIKPPGNSQEAIFFHKFSSHARDRSARDDVRSGNKDIWFASAE